MLYISILTFRNVETVPQIQLIILAVDVERIDGKFMILNAKNFASQLKFLGSELLYLEIGPSFHSKTCISIKLTSSREKRA